LLRRESLIGVVSSSDIRWRENTGYSLVITNDRLVCSARPEFDDDYWAFFPPGDRSDAPRLEEAEKKASEMIARRIFEMQRDRLVKVIYDPPGELFGGRLFLVSVGRKIEFKISMLSPWNPGIFKTVETLVDCLLSFAPRMVYNEKTGQRMDLERTSLAP
jgi:hypothetical protein